MFRMNRKKITEQISMLPFLNHAILILKNNKNVAKYLFLIQDLNVTINSSAKLVGSNKKIKKASSILKNTTRSKYYS